MKIDMTEDGTFYPRRTGAPPVTPSPDPGLVAVTQALPENLRDRHLLVSVILGVQGTEEEILGILNEVELALVVRYLETHPWLKESGMKDQQVRAEARRLGKIPDLQEIYYFTHHPEEKER